MKVLLVPVCLVGLYGLIAGCGDGTVVARSPETRIVSEWDYLIIKKHTYIQYGSGYGKTLVHDQMCIRDRY